MFKKKQFRLDVNSIPTLPAIAVEAIRLIEGEQSNFKSIADLLKNDQVLTGRILHYANTANIGSRSEVTSISRAIGLLGFNTVRSIILSVSIFDCFSDGSSNKSNELVNFWLHSIGVAVTSELLAKKLSFKNLEDAYIGGLIHDLGKLVFYMQSREEFEKVCLELRKGGSYDKNKLLPLEIESKTLGTTHIDIGKTIGDQWMFPSVLTNAMWMHHQPIIETIKPDNENIYQIIRLADILCITHNIGNSYFLSKDSYDHQHYHLALEKIMVNQNLSTDDIKEIMNSVVDKTKEVANILGYCDEEIYHNLISSANISLGSMSRNLELKNQELTSVNKILNATYELNKKIKSILSLEETIQEILISASKTFKSKSALCMIRNDRSNEFTGLIYTAGNFEEFSVPIKKFETKTDHKYGESDIEQEALKYLKKTSADLSNGSMQETGVVDIVSGSQFLATIFVADKKLTGSHGNVFGELMIDFQDTAIEEENLKDLTRNFEIFSSAASSLVERVLLEKELGFQVKNAAEILRKMEENQQQLFNSHRLATVGSLAAGAAHEINNPLTIISLHLQIIERKLEKENGNSDIRKRLKTISEQEQRISKIISDLMGFARPTQAKLGSANISDIMDKVLAVLGDRVSMNMISVKNDIPLNLPKVMVDSLQIEQVFMNLLINANHSMPEGGKIHINVETETDNMLTVCIKDTGLGITQENMGKIFDPFFTTKREGEGTGLGLAVCHSIVEHNGGSMFVDSTVGKGSIFYVKLPIDKASRLNEMKKIIDKKAEKKQTINENCRVLIVDDERILNETVQECLKDAGYEVDAAYDGVEGIGMLRYKKYHLLILDIRMPRKDGFDVLKFVSNEYPETKVIIITGLATDEEIKKTIKMGAYACIKKPFKIELIMERVNQAIKDICFVKAKLNRK